MVRIAFFALPLGLAACAPPFAGTSWVSARGEASLPLAVVEGVSQGGQRAPEYDAVCRERVGDLVGTEIVTTWSIDTRTDEESATTTLLGETVPLNPEGLEEVYQFVSSALPPALEARDLRLIIFSMTLERREPVSELLFSFDDEPYQCTVSTPAREPG